MQVFLAALTTTPSTAQRNLSRSLARNHVDVLMGVFLCDVKHPAPTVALNQLRSGLITMTVTQTAAVGGVRWLTGYCVQATQGEYEAQVNIIFARVILDTERRTVTSAPQKKEVNFLPKPEIAEKKRKFDIVFV